MVGTQWRTLGLVVACLASVIGVAVATAVATPQKEIVVATAKGSPGWRAYVTYTPTRSRVLISVTMDDLSRWTQVRFRVASTESWMPVWEGAIDGAHDDFFAISYLSVPAPVPVDSNQAKEVATSFTIYVNGDGEDHIVTFEDAVFAHPASTPIGVDGLRGRLRGDVRLVD